MKEKIITRIRSIKREQLLVAVLIFGLAAVALLPVSGREDETEVQMPSPGEESEMFQATVEEQLALQLIETLRLVEGVGEVTAAVTLETTGKKIVEKDVPTSSSVIMQEDSEGGKQNTDNRTQEETTVYEQSRDGGQTPYVISETMPEIRGVLVVAKGGGDPVIVQQIQGAVMALFHVEAHKIKVMKMK